MDAAPLDQPEAITSAGLGDYVAWVRRNWPSNDGNELILEKPGVDVPERLEEARAQGIGRIVAGFLPDEQDWPEPGGGDLAQWFLTHLDFRPWRLGLERPIEGSDRPAVVVVTDHDSYQNSPATPGALGQACAMAKGSESVVVAIGKTNESGLVRELTRSSLVINVVENWSAGFAIDEAAARLGVGVVRLYNPGYSPLRYALLGQELPPERSPDVLHLRSFLNAAHWRSGRRHDVGEVDAWFGGRMGTMPWSNGGHLAVCSHWWRHVYSWAGFKLFWSGLDLLRHVRPSSERPDRWLNRPMAWAALTAVARDGVFSSPVAVAAAAIMMQWLAVEIRELRPGWFREMGITRWVRRNPKGLHDLARALGSGREAGRALLRWVERSIDAHAPESPTWPVLREALTVPGLDLSKSPRLAAVISWAQDWSAVSRLERNDRRSTPADRAACAEACWQRIRAIDRRADRPTELPHSDTDGWIAALGEAGPLLRVLALLRRGDTDAARRGWRELVRAENLAPPVSGWRRLTETAWPGENEFLGALRTFASRARPTAGNLSITLVADWHRRRRWHLRCHLRPERLQMELATAIRLLAAVDPNPIALRLRVLLYAQAGNVDETRSAVTESPDGRGAACSAALDLGMQGMLAAAAVLVEEGRPAEADPPPRWLTFAIATQLLGHSEADAAVRRLRELAPDFFQNEAAADGRWAWAGILCHRAGHQAAAERLCAQAVEIGHGVFELVQAAPPATRELPDGWKELLRPGGWLP